MLNNPLMASMTTQKQLLWFKFKDSETVFLLSPQGKLQVKWNSINEKTTLFRLIKNLLVPRDGQVLRITPKMQQPWIEYPPPEAFRLYWCEEVTEYSQKGPTVGSDLEKTESIPFTQTLQALAEINNPVYLRRLPDACKPIFIPQRDSRRLSDWKSERRLLRSENHGKNI
jgi:hypothetical protein